MNDAEANKFFDVLNQLHPSLQFTMETESDGKLPFMDVLVKRIEDEFIRSVYRKPTFTGLYTRWDSFCDARHKTNLIRSLMSRAVKICSPSELQGELSNLKNIFAANGYPLDIINNTMKKVISTPATNAKDQPTTTAGSEATPQPVVLTLPWKGKVSSRFRQDIQKTVQQSFSNVRMHVIFTARRAFSPAVKDALPTTMMSNVVYKFACHCTCTYVGRTSQQLGERIKQHLPSKLFKAKPNLKIETADSAITKHLKQHPACIRTDLVDSFKILARARHQRHLEILEAAYIKALNPALCQQKDLSKYLSLGT